MMNTTPQGNAFKEKSLVNVSSIKLAIQSILWLGGYVKKIVMYILLYI